MVRSKNKRLLELKAALDDLESFVTLCYARFNMNIRTLDFVDCGHTGILQWHGEKELCETRHGSDLPIGIRAAETLLRWWNVASHSLKESER